MRRMRGSQYSGDGASKKLLRNRWLIGLAAGVVGMGIGMAGNGSEAMRAVPQQQATVSAAPEVTVTAVTTATATATSVVTETVDAAPQGLADVNGSGARGGKPEKREEGSGVYFASCKEAKAAGAAPLHRGDPGYRAKLDRDDDGVACER